MKNRIGMVLQDLVRKRAENPNLSTVNQCGFMSRKPCLNNLLEFFEVIPAKVERKILWMVYNMPRLSKVCLIRSYIGDYQQGTEPSHKW